MTLKEDIEEMADNDRFLCCNKIHKVGN